MVQNGKKLGQNKKNHFLTDFSDFWRKWSFFEKSKKRAGTLMSCGINWLISSVYYHVIDK